MEASASTTDSVKLPKPRFGQIVVLQKNGEEPRGHGFPLINKECVIGRSEDADIRISSADVSLVHARIVINEETGECSLQVHGRELELNGTVVDPVASDKPLLMLNHKDVVLIGGRRLRFEYLPPDFKPLPCKKIALEKQQLNLDVKAEDDEEGQLRAEVVDNVEVADGEDELQKQQQQLDDAAAEVKFRDEVEEAVDGTTAAAADLMMFTPSTATSKRVSFGPYLSPEQFDNTLPPATPVKRGATPRTSRRYSGLKFTRSSSIAPLVEEETTIVGDEEESKSETTEAESGGDGPVTGSIVALDESTMQSSTSADGMSDVSNTAVVPSECTSFLDEDISCCTTDDINSTQQQIEQDEMEMEGQERNSNETNTISKMGGDGDNDSNEQSDSDEFFEPSVLDETPADSTRNQVDEEKENLLNVTYSPAAKTKLEKPVEKDDDQGVEMGEEEEIFQSPSRSHSPPSSISAVAIGDETRLLLSPTTTGGSPSRFAADSTAMEMQLLQTPKATTASSSNNQGNENGSRKTTRSAVAGNKVSNTPKADYVTNVAGIKKLMETPKPAPETPKADYTNVKGIRRLMKTPAATKVNADDAMDYKNYSEVEGVKKLLQTPKAPPETPKADYDLNVDEGIKNLMETPKASTTETALALDSNESGVKRIVGTRKVKTKGQVAVSVTNTPIADYTNVAGVKNLLQTPKVPPQTPKADYDTNVDDAVSRLMKTPNNGQGEVGELMDDEKSKSADDVPQQQQERTEEDAVANSDQLILNKPLETSDGCNSDGSSPIVSLDSGCQTPVEGELIGINTEQCSIEATQLDLHVNEVVVDLNTLPPPVAAVLQEQIGVPGNETSTSDSVVSSSTQTQKMEVERETNQVLEPPPPIVSNTSTPEPAATSFSTCPQQQDGNNQVTFSSPIRTLSEVISAAADTTPPQTAMSSTATAEQGEPMDTKEEGIPVTPSTRRRAASAKKTPSSSCRQSATKRKRAAAPAAELSAEEDQEPEAQSAKVSIAPDETEENGCLTLATDTPLVTLSSSVVIGTPVSAQRRGGRGSVNRVATPTTSSNKNSATKGPRSKRSRLVVAPTLPSLDDDEDEEQVKDNSVAVAVCLTPPPPPAQGIEMPEESFAKDGIAVDVENKLAQVDQGCVVVPVIQDEKEQPIVKDMVETINSSSSSPSSVNVSSDMKTQGDNNPSDDQEEKDGDGKVVESTLFSSQNPTSAGDSTIRRGRGRGRVHTAPDVDTSSSSSAVAESSQPTVALVSGIKGKQKEKEDQEESLVVTSASSAKSKTRATPRSRAATQNGPKSSGGDARVIGEEQEKETVSVASTPSTPLRASSRMATVAAAKSMRNQQLQFAQQQQQQCASPDNSTKSAASVSTRAQRKEKGKEKSDDNGHGDDNDVAVLKKSQVTRSGGRKTTTSSKPTTKPTTASKEKKKKAKSDSSEEEDEEEEKIDAVSSTSPLPEPDVPPARGTATSKQRQQPRATRKRVAKTTAPSVVDQDVDSAADEKVGPKSNATSREVDVTSAAEVRISRSRAKAQPESQLSTPSLNANADCDSNSDESISDPTLAHSSKAKRRAPGSKSKSSSSVIDVTTKQDEEEPPASKKARGNRVRPTRQQQQQQQQPESSGSDNEETKVAPQTKEKGSKTKKKAHSAVSLQENEPVEKKAKVVHFEEEEGEDSESNEDDPPPPPVNAVARKTTRSKGGLSKAVIEPVESNSSSTDAKKKKKSEASQQVEMVVDVPPSTRQSTRQPSKTTAAAVRSNVQRGKKAVSVAKSSSSSSDNSESEDEVDAPEISNNNASVAASHLELEETKPTRRRQPAAAASTANAAKSSPTKKTLSRQEKQKQQPEEMKASKTESSKTKKSKQRERAASPEPPAAVVLSPRRTRRNRQ